MNKFAAIFALIALVGAVAANPTQTAEVAQAVDDIMDTVSYAEGEETVDISEMRKEDLYFADFCKQATDVFKQYLQSNVHSSSAKIYNILFTSVQEVGQAVIDSQREAASEGSNLIQGGETAVDSASDAEAAASMVGKVKAATMNVVSSMVETVKSQVFVKIAELRELYNIDTLKQTIEDVCASVSNDLQRRLEQMLTESKNSIKKATSKAPDAKEILAIVQKAKIGNVGCKLTGRVSKVSEACAIYKLASDRIWSALGYE